jgi:hypothetical protein
MTGAHETEFERAVRVWEETGVLPPAQDEQSRRLRRVLLAVDLDNSDPSEREIDEVLCRLPLGATPSHGSAGAQVRHFLEDVRATLRVDLMRANPAFRSGARTAPAIYETARFTVTISVGAETIRGSVHPRETAVLPAGGRAVLRLAEVRLQAALDPQGGFLFEELEICEGDLEIEIDGQRIQLGALPDTSV